jgi:hypothetical protein
LIPEDAQPREATFFLQLIAAELTQSGGCIGRRETPNPGMKSLEELGRRERPMPSLRRVLRRSRDDDGKRARSAPGLWHGCMVHEALVLDHGVAWTVVEHETGGRR